jgi:hypothetical protein
MENEMNVAHRALKFTSFGKNLRAVEVPGGKVSVSLVQEFTTSDMKAVTYSEIGDIYLAMMRFAKQHNLTLIDSETKALAFLMNTHGVGSLWFDGRFFSQTLLHDGECFRLRIGESREYVAYGSFEFGKNGQENTYCVDHAPTQEDFDAVASALDNGYTPSKESK